MDARLLKATLAIAAAGCNGSANGVSIEVGTGGASSSTGSAQAETDPAASSDTTSGTAASTTTTTGGAEETSTTDGVDRLCEAIDISLVFDRQAPIYGFERRLAVAEFLDAVTEQTGARVRVFPNAGAPQPPPWACSLDAQGPANGLTFIWGDAGKARNSARTKLECVYDGVRDYPSETSADGDWMFTGLLFPFLEHDDWPSEDRTISVSIMLANTDDDEGNMYARPGLASDAFLRLAADGDRDRALSLTVGQDADELHSFALALHPNALHTEWDDEDFEASFDDFLPAVVQACATADEPDVPEPPGGCEHIDILFVVDGSLSMAEEQAALRGIEGPPVFADFTDALALNLDTLEDIHIGVVSAEPDDTALHTHRDQPALPPGPETDCGLAQPWIVAPSPTLQEDFACLAATTATSTLETTSRNAAEALASADNAGFLRDDSVVFVVMLTDEDTLGLGATRVQEHELLLSAVGGDRDRVVMLAIAGDPGVFEAPKTTCAGPYGTASPGRRLGAIVASFGAAGSTSDICDGDLAQSFDEALGDLVQACVSFVPEG